MENLASIILAAGKGKRMKTFLPKVAVEFAGKPMISRVIEKTIKLKIRKICVIVGHKKELVYSCLEKFPNIEFAVQKRQSGTADAVLSSKIIMESFVGDVIILSGDVPLITTKTIDKMVSYHKKKGYTCTVLTAKLPDPSSYGRIITNTEGTIKKIIEYKDATDAQREINEINSGIYCFSNRELFRYLPKIKSNNRQKEFYLTDMIELLKKNGKTVGRFVIENSIEIQGVNSQKELKELEKIYFRQNRLTP